MACRRSVSTTATFVTRRFHPSFSPILHDNNEDTKSSNSSSSPPLIKGTFPSGSFKSTVGFHLGSRCGERAGSSLAWNMGLGSFHCRYMSTVIGDGSDKNDDIGYFAEVIADKPMEAVTSQAPAISEVAAAAADSFFPIAALQHFIDAVHSFAGVNWWASIALTTILIRVTTIPLLINQLRATTQLNLMRPKLEELKRQMQNMEMDPNVLQESQKRVKALFKEYGVNPLSQLQPLFVQGPIFIWFFLAVRNMAEKVPSFQTGGTLWFTDLSTPDSLLILPILTALTFLITVECNMQEGLEGNPIAQTMKNYSRIFAAISVPVMMSFPKALFCYWLTSNLFSLTYGLVIRRPEVKSFLGLPEIPVPPPPSSEPRSFLSSAIEKDTTIESEHSLSAEPSKATDRRISRTSMLKQRLRILENKIKGKKKQTKM